MAVSSKANRIPLYSQIRNSLYADIVNKILVPGERLPAEDELATTFGVSRMTVRQGISELVDEGLLYRRHGVGTFVAHPNIVRDHTRLTNLVEIAKSEGIDINIHLLVADLVPSKPKIARELSLEEGDLAFRVKTLRYTSGLPITLHDAYVPYNSFPQLLQEDLQAKHLWEIFESLGHRVKRAIQKMEAREADEEIAHLLKMDAGAPIFYKERTVYLDDGTPCEFAYCYNRGDRYKLTVAIDR